MFEEVLNHPELFLGIRSVSRLNAFMNGYGVALDRAGVPVDDSLYCGFYGWIARHFRIKTSHGWSEIVLFMSSNDESKAIDLTVELWGKYKSEMSRDGRSEIS